MQQALEPERARIPLAYRRAVVESHAWPDAGGDQHDERKLPPPAFDVIDHQRGLAVAGGNGAESDTHDRFTSRPFEVRFGDRMLAEAVVVKYQPLVLDENADAGILVDSCVE